MCKLPSPSSSLPFPPPSLPSLFNFPIFPFLSLIIISLFFMFQPPSLLLVPAPLILLPPPLYYYKNRFVLLGWI